MAHETVLAVFSGNPDIEKAIGIRLGALNDHAGETKLTLPDGSPAPRDWPCAIFGPDAGMHGFGEMHCISGCILDGPDACAQYRLPKGTRSAVFMALWGDGPTALDFCQAVCDRSGMRCHILDDSDALSGEYAISEILKPVGQALDPSRFIAGLYALDE